VNRATITAGAVLTLAISGVVIAGQGRRTAILPSRRAAMNDDWPTYGLNQAETRFSRLTAIHTSNVGQLVPFWSFDLGSGGGGQEATPLVSDGVMYLITNWSVVIAVDARTGLEIWRSDPDVDRLSVRPVICCGVVNRGVAIYRDLIVAPVIDGRLRALRAADGEIAWETRVAHPTDHYTITMAPRIAGDKVIIGVSGSDRPSRGFFDAYDARTGQQAWRFYTVPGDPSKPFENDAMRRAASTWDQEWWTRGGGGAVWDGMAYDPTLRLVYVGTGNAEPWAYQLRSSRGKDNFQSLGNGRLMAYSADAGEKLLDLDTGLRSGMGPPITYRIDGRQFVAVMGGVGVGFDFDGQADATTSPLTPKLLTFSIPERTAAPRAIRR
jgi:quinohemoprotein ethanol dehydrogenase